MMLGKRPGRPAPARHPMRRTTSMTEFAPPDLLPDVAEEELEDEEAELQLLPAHAEGEAEDPYGCAVVGAAAARRADWLAAYRARAAPALAGLWRNSVDFSAAEAAAFLRACGLCNRRLGPGRDTFMYKGEAAFCSLECRERHMTQEEWKDKCAVTSIKDAAAAAPVTSRRGGSGKPGAGGTVAAA